MFRGEHYAHVTHMSCITFIFYLADQNLQRSTIGYISNSWILVYILLLTHWQQICNEVVIKDPTKKSNGSV